MGAVRVDARVPAAPSLEEVTAEVLSHLASPTRPLRLGALPSPAAFSCAPDGHVLHSLLMAALQAPEAADASPEAVATRLVRGEEAGGRGGLARVAYETRECTLATLGMASPASRGWVAVLSAARVMMVELCRACVHVGKLPGVDVVDEVAVVKWLLALLVDAEVPGGSWRGASLCFRHNIFASRTWHSNEYAVADADLWGLLMVAATSMPSADDALKAHLSASTPLEKTRLGWLLLLARTRGAIRCLLGTGLLEATWTEDVIAGNEQHEHLPSDVFARGLEGESALGYGCSSASMARQGVDASPEAEWLDGAELRGQLVERMLALAFERCTKAEAVAERLITKATSAKADGTHPSSKELAQIVEYVASIAKLHGRVAVSKALQFDLQQLHEATRVCESTRDADHELTLHALRSTLRKRARFSPSACYAPWWAELLDGRLSSPAWAGIAWQQRVIELEEQRFERTSSFSDASVLRFDPPRHLDECRAHLQTALPRSVGGDTPATQACYTFHVAHKALCDALNQARMQQHFFSDDSVVLAGFIGTPCDARDDDVPVVAATVVYKGDSHGVDEWIGKVETTRPGLRTGLDLDAARDYLEHIDHGGCLVSCMAHAVESKLALTTTAARQLHDLDVPEQLVDRHPRLRAWRELQRLQREPSKLVSVLDRMSDALLGRKAEAEAEDVEISMDTTRADRRPVCYAELDDRDAPVEKTSCGRHMSTMHRQKWRTHFEATPGAERAVSLLRSVFHKERARGLDNLVKVVERRAGSLLYAFAASIDVDVLRRLEPHLSVS